VDRVPTIQIISPEDGSVQTGPFDVKVTATFKPTLNSAKGSINCYYGSPTNPTNLFLSKQCTTESCTIKHSELKGKLWEPPTGEYGVVCKATAGSNGSANDTKNFKVDKTPIVSITSPIGKVLSPFDIAGEITFKPTLNSSKGSYTVYLNNNVVSRKSCNTESCDYSYKAEKGVLYTMAPGGPHKIKITAVGGGSTKTDEKEFEVYTCDTAITKFEGVSTIIDPTAGGEILLSGSITDTSGKPITWTIDIAGAYLSGTDNDV
jgi:hypothetical protein